MSRSWCFFQIVIVLAMCGTPAFAQEAATPKSLGTYGVWNAYTFKENGQPVCYMVAKLPVVRSKKLKRGSAWLTITHRPAETSKDVVSYTSGYNFQAGSDVTVHIGKDDFDLFTQKDTAWSRDAKTDHALAAAIRKNSDMTVTGTPATRGAKPAIDTLDIKGAEGAYHAIGMACGLETPASPKKSHKKSQNK